MRGDEAISTDDDVIANTRIEVEQQYNVTRIVVGWTRKWGVFSRSRSLANEITELSDSIDVIIRSGGS